jgi:hypothetical protein
VDGVIVENDALLGVKQAAVGSSNFYTTNFISLIDIGDNKGVLIQWQGQSPRVDLSNLLC